MVGNAVGARYSDANFYNYQGVVQAHVCYEQDFEGSEKIVCEADKWNVMKGNKDFPREGAFYNLTKCKPMIKGLKKEIDPKNIFANGNLI